MVRLPSKLAFACIYLVLIMVMTHVHLPVAVRETIGHWDKPLHFVFYTGLGALVFVALPGSLGRSTWVPVATTIGMIAVIAAVDEFAQGWQPSRTADVIDWLADMAGGIAGTCAVVATRTLRRDKSHEKVETPEQSSATALPTDGGVQATSAKICSTTRN